MIFWGSDQVQNHYLPGPFRLSALVPRWQVFGPGLFLFAELGVAEALNRVIIHHSDRLHEGVADR